MAVSDGFGSGFHIDPALLQQVVGQQAGPTTAAELLQYFTNLGASGNVPGGFLTPEQTREWLAQRFATDEAMRARARAEAEQGLSVKQQSDVIKSQAKKDMTKSAWNSASRGLANSSIRDMALSDIDLAAGLQRQHLEDNLTMLRNQNAIDNQKTLQDWWTYDQSWTVPRIENAKQASAPTTGDSNDGSNNGSNGSNDKDTTKPIAETNKALNEKPKALAQPGALNSNKPVTKPKAISQQAPAMAKPKAISTLAPKKGKK